MYIHIFYTRIKARAYARAFRSSWGARPQAPSSFFLPWGSLILQSLALARCNGPVVGRIYCNSCDAKQSQNNVSGNLIRMFQKNSKDSKRFKNAHDWKQFTLQGIRRLHNDFVGFLAIFLSRWKRSRRILRTPKKEFLGFDEDSKDSCRFLRIRQRFPRIGGSVWVPTSVKH